MPGLQQSHQPQNEHHDENANHDDEIIATPPDSKECRVKGITSTSKPSRTKRIAFWTSSMARQNLSKDSCENSTCE